MEMLSDQGKSHTGAELARRRTEVAKPGDPGDPDTGGGSFVASASARYYDDQASFLQDLQYVEIILTSSAATI